MRTVHASHALERVFCAAVVALLCFAIPAIATPSGDLHGAGSTFVQPVLQAWAQNWSQRSGTKINYESVGSGAGVDKLKAGQVDFAATDAPLSDADLAAGKFVQFPIVAGGIVVVANLPNAARKRLQINGEVLADILLGQITVWNDPKLVALNAGMSLPAAPIKVIHRSDSSGITYNFTAYLSKVSPAFKEKVGIGKNVTWPTGTGVDGNVNLAAAVSSTPNSLGYVEYGYALQHEMHIAGLHDASGRTVSPSQTSISAAVQAADWAHASHFNLMLVGVQGTDAWPIAVTTWAVVPASQQKNKVALDFLRFVLHSGGTTADSMGYTPLPDSLVKLIDASFAKDLTN